MCKTHNVVCLPHAQYDMVIIANIVADWSTRNNAQVGKSEPKGI